jgi:post-segregation antitoxin (ccd killing protein)
MSASQLPTWPEFARSLVSKHLEVVSLSEEAIANGCDKKEATQWRRLVRESQALLDRNQITILR